MSFMLPRAEACLQRDFVLLFLSVRPSVRLPVNNAVYTLYRNECAYRQAF